MRRRLDRSQRAGLFVTLAGPAPGAFWITVAAVVTRAYVEPTMSR